MFFNAVFDQSQQVIIDRTHSELDFLEDKQAMLSNSSPHESCDLRNISQNSFPLVATCHY